VVAPPRLIAIVPWAQSEGRLFKGRGAADLGIALGADAG
jgi:hypothetical protein